jgi:hypothetical protein
MGNMQPISNFYEDNELDIEYIVISNVGDKNDDYLCIEQFCDNPHCKCQDIIASFFLIDKEYNISEETVSFIYSMNNDAKPKLINGCERSNLTDSLLAEFTLMVKDADYIARLEEHYRLLKVRAIRIIDPQAHSIKVGRNEKCPCGSGKKYKKCCLIKTLN